MDCSDVIEKLGEYLDEEARKDLCSAIEQHLSQCRDCRIEVDTVRKTIVLYQSDHEMKTPVSITAQLEVALAREYERRVATRSSD